MAFFTLLSLPPAMLAILGSLGFLADALGPEVTMAVREQILGAARAFLTNSTVEEIVEPTVSTLLQEGRPDVVSVGVVLAIWSASRATSAVIDTVRIAYDIEHARPGWRRRLVALGLTLGFAAAVVFLLPALVAGPRLGARLARPVGLEGAVETLWAFLYWPVVAGAGIAFLATFYSVALPRRTRWRRQLPGAVLALVAWVLGSVAVRLYAIWTLESASAYGSLSAPLVLLLWLYALGLAVLLGAELNAEIEKLRTSGAGAMERPREAPEVFRTTY